MSARLDVFLPLPLTHRGPSYTCGMISKGMASPELSVTIVTPRQRKFSVHPAQVVQALPYWARFTPYRWVRKISEREIYSALRSQVEHAGRSQPHGVYIWPDASIDSIRELKRKGIKTFREMINCHRGTAKNILDDAYGRLGLDANHTITEASVVAEQAALEEVDYIFCPNAMVEASLLENGLPPSKFVPASYGWDPLRFEGAAEALKRNEGITAVFAGTICVRKGSHLLLEYWARSNVKGRLVLAGAMEPAIKEKCAALLAREDIIVLDFVSDIGSVYRSADVFVFPSLEEGGPQVTYEACGCGLPVITTPMGTGRIIRHGQEGFVIDPYDAEGWIAALQQLADDKERRVKMSVAAAERAREFHWSVVAARRREQVLQRLFNTGFAQSPISERADGVL